MQQLSLVPPLQAVANSVAIETRSLTRQVSGKVLVADVSVVVETGEILAITGPSGAGKSSLLRLLNRLDEPTSGTVLIPGGDYRQFEPAILRRRVGMVMQTANLFPGSIKSNLEFGPAQRNTTISDAQVEDLLERVGLPGRGGDDVSTLSGGEAQRVSFARTLANDPEILLLDEPTSALDEETARGIEQLVTNITSGGKVTCLIVTHNAAQAARLAPRTLYLIDGKVAKLGPTKDVLNAYEPV